MRTPFSKSEIIAWEMKQKYVIMMDRWYVWNVLYVIVGLAWRQLRPFLYLSRRMSRDVNVSLDENSDAQCRI